MVELFCSLTAKEADQRTIESGVSSVELMRRVAVGVLENLPETKGKILIVCGKGGNGGDGYALYLLMKKKGLSVFLTDFGESRHEGAASLRILCGKEIIPFPEDLDFSEYSTIIDCIFGVGLSRAPQGEYLAAIKKINAAKANVVSVDIASGLTTDGGIALGAAVQADITIAVQSLKAGHFLGDGLDCTGQVGALDIGISPLAPDAYLVEEEDVIPLFPPLKRNLHKGARGRIAVLAGCDAYSGAAVLAELGASAFALGDGLVRLCVPNSILYPVMNKITECTLCAMPDGEKGMVYDEKALAAAIEGEDAVLFGNGIGISEDAEKILVYLIREVKVPLILDADALNLLSRNPLLLKERVGETVLTPHPREMSRLMGIPTEEILSDPISYAKEFAARYGVTLLLKSASTVITDGKVAYISATGSPGMAKGGSGDLLAGAVASLIAGGRALLPAAYGAAYILGVAGEYAAQEVGEYSSLPTDTHRYVARVVKALAEKAAKNR